MKHIYDYLTENRNRNPQKIAVSDEFGSFTYSELDDKSSSLALKLKEMGVGINDRVCVYVPYVKEIFTGTFAAMRCGGVYVPLEYSYPFKRLNYIIENSCAKVILTTRSAWKEKPLFFPEEKIIFMDDECKTCPPVSEDVPSDSPAMILYTSGTTGNPKGVVLPHTQMTSLMDWAFIHEGTKLDENSIAGIISGLTFSATTLILYSTIMYDGTVILAPDSSRKDINRLYDFLIKNKITHTFMSATLAATMAEHYDISKINIFAGGEKLRNFNPVNSEIKIINTYGCTELGAIISAVIHGNEDPLPSGRLSPDTEAMIVNENLEQVKDGEAGELIVTNKKMAKSYLDLPEQTQKKWIQINGKTWYHTGDRAKRTQDGIYYILGRTDDMIKIRGFRVETGEVEGQISNLLTGSSYGVKSIAVVVRNINGIDHLTCYYECAEDINTKNISYMLSESLADYMIPDIWIRMDSMPRNPNGKIIRAELPEPKRTISKRETILNKKEARVVEIASEVLGITDYVSPEDSFVELGGTSVKAMEFAAKLHDIGIEISSSQILKLGVLREIASESKMFDIKDVYFYSDKPKKKIFFVHTGNTGSEAYYSLAKRIKKNFSFAVIEPYNLYHPDTAEYGIKKIASRYIKTLKKYQSEGPYILGGWCYGGVIAHEMACQLQAAGEKIECLILMDSHVLVEYNVKKFAEYMYKTVGRHYFETCYLFEEMRKHGMLERLIKNSENIRDDMLSHKPSHYDGKCLYFKPKEIPHDANGKAKKYWALMKKEYIAGGFESYCRWDKVKVIETAHEHDLMMDKVSLDIIVPEMYSAILQSKE